jgi:hypothetical protein
LDLRKTISCVSVFHPSRERQGAVSERFGTQNVRRSTKRDAFVYANDVKWRTKIT